MLKTPLQQQHLQSGAKLVEFAGWQMPLRYGSQIDEHMAVRRHAGVFDVSHMTIVDITGDDAKYFLRYLLANDVGKLTNTGKALYSCMLNPEGGVIDDLIVYFISPTHYRMVVNAATRANDLDWINTNARVFSVSVNEVTDLAMIAVQGPDALVLARQAMPVAQAQASTSLKLFFSCLCEDWFIARTGYTGEDGFEIALPIAQAGLFWQALIEQGVTPCGLAARDTLRLEAGLNLYGSDMDTTTSPLASNLGWTIAWQPEDRDFIGREALSAQTVTEQLVGLILQDRGVLRGGQPVIIDDEAVGLITSGSFSPFLQQSIGLARIPVGEYQYCQVRIRNNLLPAQITKPVFVRKGQSC